MKFIYLDNSATTRPLARAIESLEHVQNNQFANPSALHKLGTEAENILENARRCTAEFLRAAEEEIYFTSSATEANNTAIKGVYSTYRHRGNHIITTEVEHPSVRAVCERLKRMGAALTYLPVDERGIINPDDLRDALRENTILCSIMAANNETGSIQPLRKISDIINSRPTPRPILHIDAVQAVGKMNFLPSELNADLVSLSAHKFHGPKGVGVLFKRRGLELIPLLDGGGQENGIRSGTENTPAIAGMKEAVEWLMSEGSEAYSSVRKLRKLAARAITEEFEQAKINGPDIDAGDSECIPNILNVSFPPIRGEVLVHALAERNIYISTGSACSSKIKDDPGTISHMTKDQGIIDGAVRISMSPFNTEKDVLWAIDTLKEVIPPLMRISNFKS